MTTTGAEPTMALTLTAPQISLIMTALGKLPLEVSGATYEIIKNQILRAARAEQEAAQQQLPTERLDTKPPVEVAATRKKK